MKQDELFAIYQRNFPFVVREEETARRLLFNEANKVFERRDEDGNVYATAVVHKGTILILCVDQAYRGKGHGSALLAEAEAEVRRAGFDSVTVGVGDDYLTPGVPTNEMPYCEALRPAVIDGAVSDEARQFFQKRGYVHAWGEANCFDMKADLAAVVLPDIKIGAVVDGVTYRCALPTEVDAVIRCTDASEPDFSQYYKAPWIYGNGNVRVLVGECDGTICATLLVNIETEGKGIGSVGCTTVMPNYRGRHIGVNIVIAGTRFLQELGLPIGFLGYTYSGLDRMYGYAGYKISVYYFMAKKQLTES